jgi:hypothetical protein
MRVESKGNIEDFLPSLMDQGRTRASSTRQPILLKPKLKSSNNTKMLSLSMAADGAISR